jgi:hypothetical protein
MEENTICLFIEDHIFVPKIGQNNLQSSRYQKAISEIQ